MRLEWLCFTILLSLGVLHLATCLELEGEPVYESLEEWTLWKSTHVKSYSSNREELERHIVWQSNRAYVDQHNINAKKGIFSYEIRLNHLADLVRHLSFNCSFNFTAMMCRPTRITTTDI